jgi:hypothetical protein
MLVGHAGGESLARFDTAARLRAALADPFWAGRYGLIDVPKR